MNFTDEDGTEYEEILKKGPLEIDCFKCGSRVKRSNVVIITSPPIYEYPCPCGHVGGISGEHTRDHWPKEVQERYRKTMKEWWDEGAKIEWGEPILILNSNAIDKINLDGGGDGGKEKEEV